MIVPNELGAVAVMVKVGALISEVSCPAGMAAAKVTVHVSSAPLLLSGVQVVDEMPLTGATAVAETPLGRWS